jgi:hypothetical protein
MKSWQKPVFVLALVVAVPVAAQIAQKPFFPSIPGYQTLLCDFHLHTVFSDGRVWPTVRADEAWRYGLDAIAITDHIEYRPFKEEFASRDLNRSLRSPPAVRQFPLLVIRGIEITRSMPPGHLNAIFLSDANPLETETWGQRSMPRPSSRRSFSGTIPAGKRSNPMAFRAGTMSMKRSIARENCTASRLSITRAIILKRIRWRSIKS